MIYLKIVNQVTYVTLTCKAFITDFMKLEKATIQIYDKILFADFDGATIISSKFSAKYLLKQLFLKGSNFLETDVTTTKMILTCSIHILFI